MSGAHGKPKDAHADAGAGHERHKPHEHEAPPGVPPWLISFGDMMTLFLCFFIVLVTMAPKQDAGLIAAGLGPFIAAMENKGQIFEPGHGLGDQGFRLLVELRRIELRAFRACPCAW